MKRISYLVYLRPSAFICGSIFSVLSMFVKRNELESREDAKIAKF